MRGRPPLLNLKTLAILGSLAVAAVSIVWASTALGQTPPPGTAILGELRAGGLVIYLRHAPATINEDAIGDAGWWKDCAKQRNLSAEGRVLARELGFVIKGLEIPVGSVVSGELCRAKQTAEGLDLGAVELSQKLNDYNTWTAQGNPKDELLEASRSLLAEVPAAGTNTVLISHTQRGRYVAHPALNLIPMGGAAVFRPDGKGGFELRAMLRAGDWAVLGIAELPSS